MLPIILFKILKRSYSMHKPIQLPFVVTARCSTPDLSTCYLKRGDINYVDTVFGTMNLMGSYVGKPEIVEIEQMSCDMIETKSKHIPLTMKGRWLFNTVIAELRSQRRCHCTLCFLAEIFSDKHIVYTIYYSDHPRSFEQLLCTEMC